MARGGALTSSLSSNLRARQRHVLKSFLNSPDFHVLVTCERSFHVISLLFSNEELREMNVTLHMRLGEISGKLPGLDAIYIVEGTEENVTQVVREVENGGYGRVEIGFLGSAGREVLGKMATAMRVPTVVGKVVDLYSTFVSLEEDLFELGVGMMALEGVVQGLLSVLITLGVIPVIRAQRGGLAEKVGAVLADRLRSCLDLFTAGEEGVINSFRRPLLLLMDRDFDLAVMMHHSWTYQGLVHDCLKLKMNRTQIRGGREDKASGKEYILDKESDPFWRRNAGVPFPEVAEQVKLELEKYRADVESINQQAGVGNHHKDAVNGSTLEIERVIGTLPELKKRKEMIDAHTNLATELLEAIKSRSLDTLYELEIQIMSNDSSFTADDFHSAVMELIRGPPDAAGGENRGAGTPEDRLRLFVIFYLYYGHQISSKKMAEYRTALRAAACDLRPVHFIQALRGFRHDDVADTSSVRTGSKRAMIRGLMKNVVNRGYRGIKAVAKNATELVGNRNQGLKVAETLSMFVSEGTRSTQPEKASLVVNGYKFFYPKVSSEDETNDSCKMTADMKKIIFSEAIVFVVGGGNYAEYQNIRDHVVERHAKSLRVIYGATEIITANECLKQMSIDNEDDSAV